MKTQLGFALLFTAAIVGMSLKIADQQKQIDEAYEQIDEERRISILNYRNQIETDKVMGSIYDRLYTLETGKQPAESEDGN